MAATSSDAGLDIITFDDPEVDFSAKLVGNAIAGPLIPDPEALTDDNNEDTPHPSQDDSSKKPHIYTVEAGDTIGKIAEEFNVSQDTIRSANGLRNSDVINVGDHLTILPTNGVLHTVKAGDTVIDIAQDYDAKPADIISFNGLSDTGALRVGQKIMVPGGTMPKPRYIAQTPDTAPDTTPDTPKPTPKPVDKNTHGMVWPTTTRHLSQGFGFRGHTGIDIDNRSRPAIFAAEDGTVEYAGWLGGYGNLTIINHGGGKQTYYGHAEKLYTHKGDVVKAGDVIAKMGSTGRSTGPHLHFEVRYNGRPVNPMGQF